jgi:protein O-mannosyl-transferase
MKAKAPVKSRNIVAKKSDNSGLFILLLLGALLGILTWFAFEPGLKNNFVDWDDLKYITENGCIQLKGKELINNLFFGECKYVMGNYHPLTVLTYAWNFQSGKFDPEVYHRTNLILHVINTLLLLLAVYKMSSGKLFTAGFAAALFALHPLHVESVIWAAERKDVLYTFFLLLALLAWLYLENSNSIFRTVLVSVLFILSCLAKGMAVVFPLILILILWITNESFNNFLKNNPIKTWMSAGFWERLFQRTGVKEFIVYFCISLFFGWMAVHSQDTQGGIRDYPQFNVLHRILLASYGFVHYLWKMVIPEGLSAVYPYPLLDENNSLPLKFTVAPVFLVLIALITAFSLRFSRMLAFGVLGYAICILPVLQILPVGEAIAADRYFYVSSIPLFIGIAWFIEKFFQENNRIIFYGASTLAVVTCGYLFMRTRDQVLVWANDLSLFSNAIEHEPTASQAQNNVGIYWQRAKEFEKALPYYEAAIKLNPVYARAYSNMGACYYDLQRYKESIPIYHKAITSDPDFADAWYNLGNSWYMLGRYDIAKKFYSHAIELNPYYYAAYYNRAVCKGVLGQHPEALVDYKVAAKGGHPQAQDALRRSNISWTDAPAIPNAPKK